MVVNKFEYWGVLGGLEYELVWLFGVLNGVGDFEVLQYVNMVCNEDGFDLIIFGVIVFVVMEFYEMGVLIKEQIGIEVFFGLVKVLVYLVEIMVCGEGFGKEVGLGLKCLCVKYGYLELLMSVKGLEFLVYDGWVIQGIGFNYVIFNWGVCYVCGYIVVFEVFGILVKIDLLVIEGKFGLVKVFQDVMMIFDLVGICLFIFFVWIVVDVQL